MPPVTKTLNEWLTIIVTIVSILTAAVTVNAFYAKSADLQKLELRVDQKITTDRYDQLQTRGWKFEDRGLDKLNPMEKEEYRKIQEEKKFIEKQLDRIIQQQKK